MDLLDELGNDLALAFLVEKKHREKIDSKEVVVLIQKIKNVLKPISVTEKPLKNFPQPEKSASISSI